MAFEYLTPFPQQLKAGKGKFARPKNVRVLAPAAAAAVPVAIVSLYS
jgi:hypothetical protein